MKHILSTLLTSTWCISEQAAIAYAPLVESYISGDITALRELKSLEVDSRLSIQNLPEGIAVGEDSVVGILPVKGGITRADFCGEMGTESMDKALKSMIADSSIVAIILDINTPGGESSYLENLSNTIAQSPKPIVTYFSGMCCSAGYYIACRSNAIFASAKSDLTGSIGTMYSFRKQNKNTNADSVIASIRATKSKDKNKMFDDIQDGKYDLLRSELLDPVNEIFHDTVKAGRSSIDESALTGNLYYSEQAIELGVIDGVKSFDEVVQYAIALATNDNGIQLENSLINNEQQKGMKKLERVSAVLGRDIVEGEVLSAEDFQLIEQSMAGEQLPVVNGITSEDLRSLVSASLAPLSEQVTSLVSRIGVLEAKPSGGPSVPAPNAPSATAPVNAWDDSNNPVNQALDAALAERGLK